MLKKIIVGVFMFTILLNIYFLPITLAEINDNPHFGTFYSSDYYLWQNDDIDHINNLINDYFLFNNKDNFCLKLLKENNYIVNTINKIKQEYEKTLQGAKLYSPDATGSICVLYQAFENRNILINMLKKNSDLADFRYDTRYFTEGKIFNKRYEIKNLLNFNNTNDNFLTAIKIFNSNVFPKGFLENIEVYISPYQLKDIDGYSYNKSVKGREEFIVIAYNNNNLLNSIDSVIYHELGHIFIGDVAGANNENVYEFMFQNKDIWDKYREIYGNSFNELSWSSSIGENIAEDFKIYLMKKNNKNSIKLTDHKYNENISDFFDDLFNKYNYVKEKPFPDFSLNINGYNMILGLDEYKIPFTIQSALIINMDNSDSIYKNFSLYIKNIDTGEIINYTKLYTRTFVNFEKKGRYQISVCIDNENTRNILSRILIDF